MYRMKRKRRFAAALAATAVTCALGAAAGRALSASNTVASSKAGAGQATIGGYTISSVVYGLNASAPQKIDKVTFTLSPTAAGSVKIKLTGTWYPCTNASGSVTCATTSPQANVNTANGTTLTVVAVS